MWHILIYYMGHSVNKTGNFCRFITKCSRILIFKQFFNTIFLFPLCVFHTFLRVFFIPPWKRSLGWPRSNVCTAVFTSSLFWNCLPRKADLSNQKDSSPMAPSQDYILVIVSCVNVTTWGRALSCWRITPFINSPRLLIMRIGSLKYFRKHAK